MSTVPWSTAESSGAWVSLRRVALNKLITLAPAEKVSAMRAQEYFEERARRVDPARFSRILDRVGKGILLSTVMNSRWNSQLGK